MFDPVIDMRHGGYKPDAKHKTDLDASKVKKLLDVCQNIALLIILGLSALFFFLAINLH